MAAMADEEDEELQMAFRMSLAGDGGHGVGGSSSGDGPEAKRSKGGGGESATCPPVFDFVAYGRGKEEEEEEEKYGQQQQHATCHSPDSSSSASAAFAGEEETNLKGSRRVGSLGRGETEREREKERELEREMERERERELDRERERERENERERARGGGGEEETPEQRDRRVRREMRAAAAERRMAVAGGKGGTGGEGGRGLVGEGEGEKGERRIAVGVGARAEVRGGEPVGVGGGERGKGVENRRGKESLRSVSVSEATKIFELVFGVEPPKEFMTQWSRQGFRFSDHPETSWGLVQGEGGPCGVLAPVQAFVMKHLLFPNGSQSGKATWHQQGVEGRAEEGGEPSTEDDLVYGDEERNRALVKALAESLWQAGGRGRAVLAVIDELKLEEAFKVENGQKDEAIAKALEGLSLDSPATLQEIIRVKECTSLEETENAVEAWLPVFRSDFGALLFLFSAVLSRSLEGVQEDRDDQEQPLVTRPFGHASQEIVNLLLCGHAAPNVFDGNVDLGGGMCLKGISSEVEVGFLTFLESLNYLKVGQRLKNPRWPVWVVGSESHYTVLFARSTSVLEDTEVETREVKIKKAFDELDTSGGGGFILPDSLRKLLAENQIDFPENVLNEFANLDIVIWNDFLQALLKLDKSRGGLAGGGGGVQPHKKFEIYHFNGIAKFDVGGGEGQQRPRLTRLKVKVPPKWTPDTVLVDRYQSYAVQEDGELEGMGDSGTVEASSTNRDEMEIGQNAQLVDCIRTRWQRANCNWVGDPPSIV